MHEPDNRFIHEDGSFDYDVALRAGREARAQGLFEGCRIVRDAVVQLVLAAWSRAAGYCRRMAGVEDKDPLRRAH